MLDLVRAYVDAKIEQSAFLFEFALAYSDAHSSNPVDTGISGILNTLKVPISRFSLGEITQDDLLDQLRSILNQERTMKAHC